MTFREAADALGFVLTDWQYKIGERIMRGENVTIMMPRQGGRTTINMIIDHAKENTP